MVGIVGWPVHVYIRSFLSENRT